MDVISFYEGITRAGTDFFTGVPDSQLKAFCDYLMDRHGISEQHIVAANEGAAVGLAAGHYLASGKPALVYMQNSGVGNAVNPVCSLLSDRVYAIPVLFVIGWRGEPGVKDEPQHKFQGEITLPLLDCLQIEYSVLEPDTDAKTFAGMVQAAQDRLTRGLCYAFVVKKGALTYANKRKYQNAAPLSREQALEAILAAAAPDGVFVSTTGKLSRELFELRERRGQGHERDFLTVGSMGHSLMIALGIAMQKPDRKVYCLDGDGAMLMHMGSLAVCGSRRCGNLVHIVINNGAHETVGGIPTVSPSLDMTAAARACGYDSAATAFDAASIGAALRAAQGLSFVEIKTNLEVRSDLGRPTTTPVENKMALMRFLREETK
ncbi:MAG: phosphonopyruvate decarboxylase [Clostridia bacterium]|nr:phosphonopyruvate decarboxylase [Clostridia bacterium]